MGEGRSNGADFKHLQEKPTDIYYRVLVEEFHHAASSAAARRSASARPQRQSPEYLAGSLGHPAENALPIAHNGGGNHCEVAQGEVLLLSNPLKHPDAGAWRRTGGGRRGV